LPRTIPFYWYWRWVLQRLIFWWLEVVAWAYPVVDSLDQLLPGQLNIDSPIFYS